MDIATTTAAGVEILSWISQYGYGILLPLFILEGASVGFLSGVLISLGALEAVPVFLLYVLGVMIADTIFYQLGRNGSTILKKISFTRRVLARIDYYKDDKDLEPQWAAKFRRNYFPLMFMAKISPIPAGALVVATVAGVLKLPRRQVYLPIIIGQPIWSGLVIAAGYYLGDTIQNPEKLLSEAGVFTAVAFIVIGLYYYYLHERLKQELTNLLSLGSNEELPD
jgi:membrane protein DedA with SNARE-associated domain